MPSDPFSAPGPPPDDLASCPQANPPGSPPAHRYAWKWRSPILKDGLVLVALAAVALAVLWPLGLTNRVLAGVDALTYFTPYWAYRMAQVQTGQLPLWNPYLFTGVPFLANPQSAVLYPLHWPLSWLSAPEALVWSAIGHAWLAAAFAYFFGRRSLRLGRAAAFLAGCLYGLGGFALARVENINQLNTLAWLPALLWLRDEVMAAKDWPTRWRWGSALAGALAMQFLAGHTQTAFINLAGLGIYSATPLLAALAGRLNASRHGRLTHSNWRAAASHLLPLVTIAPALLLASAQLLPSLELSSWGLRTGGLPYRQAVSFSLRPQWLLQSLLPPFGGGLPEAFGGEGYAEFVAYGGVAALLLAGAGLTAAFRGPPVDLLSPKPAPQSNWPGLALILLAIAGLGLALGAYNPIYYLLWRVVPGFALFRAPARWLELYCLATAGLAGIGLDRLARVAQPLALRLRPAGSRLGRAAIVAALAVGIVALALQVWPSPKVALYWLIAAAAGLTLILMSRRRPSAARATLVAAGLVELWLGARSLPFTLATAPDAVGGLRLAPAALLAGLSGEPPAGRERFISLSDIRYDPGDLSELRALEADRLPAGAVDLMVRAAKQTEVLSPNLSLLFGLPSVDGYDGGALPLASYAKLQSLFLPVGQTSPDGRMREQLHEIPPARLLDLTATRFVITDKQNDLWVNDVYYDLEQPVTIPPGQVWRLDLSGLPSFSATTLGVISYLAPNGIPPSPASVAAEVTLYDALDRRILVPMAVGKDTDIGRRELAAPSGLSTVARAWPAGSGQAGNDYLAWLPFGGPFTPVSMEIAVPPGAQASVVLRGMSLFDDRTGAHISIAVSPKGDFRRILSGDVKVYERSGTEGRAWLVHQATPAGSDSEALAELGQDDFEPRLTVVLTDQAGELPWSAANFPPVAAAEQVTATSWEPEHIALSVTVQAPGWLVVADSYYPGWYAQVDGLPAQILRANVAYRAIALGPGHHEVVMDFQPTSWRIGSYLSLAALISMAVSLIVVCFFARRHPNRAV